MYFNAFKSDISHIFLINSTLCLTVAKTITSTKYSDPTTSFVVYFEINFFSKVHFITKGKTECDLSYTYL